MYNFKNIIIGNRITLKKISPSEKLAATLFEVATRNREDILSWMSFKEEEIIPKDKNDALRILQDIENWIKDEIAIYYGIFIDGNFIGMVMAGLDKSRKEAETGAWLDKLERGKGYAKEARLLLDEELFSNGIIKLISYVDVENISSKNMILSLGYENGGIIKNNSYQKFKKEYRDEFMFFKIKQ
ncbi:MAG: GNAT family N-acetyltransferase [Rickettsiales bacterium]|jgi:RimJ/RimL family protein N-acetyltransferase|nr:GNAT family N-acetyltransferase [Rickettsiales bacterium]